MYKRMGKPLPTELEITKRPKYNNRKTIYNGEVYHSKAEASRAAELELLQKSGEIAAYLRQIPFELEGGIVYICDFLVLYPDGHFGIEDVKGGEATMTDTYKLKRKLMKARGFTITEVIYD